MNRLREIRQEKKLTLKEVSEKLKSRGVKISPDGLAKYERGEREPKIDKYEAIANVFNVPTAYLMGISDDLTGWEEWSENTGFTIQQIKDEIQRLIDTKRLDKSADIQQKIRAAVSSLDHASYATSRGAQHELIIQLTSLINKVGDAFLEPQEPEKSGSVLPSPNSTTVKKVRKDMDSKAYQKMLDALYKARATIEQTEIDDSF